MGTQPHRDTRAAFPDAKPGTCRWCGNPCAVNRRSHTDCAETGKAHREHRATMIDREGGKPVCVYRDTSPCSGPIESHHVQELSDNGDKGWTVPACRKHHNERTQEARQARRDRNRERPMSKSKSKGAAASPATWLDHILVTLLVAALAVTGWAIVTGNVHSALAWASDALDNAQQWAPKALTAVVVATVVLMLARLLSVRRNVAVERLAETIARTTNTIPGAVRVRVGLTTASGSAHYTATFDDRPGTRTRAAVEEAIERKVGHPLTFTWQPSRDTVRWRRRRDDDTAETVADELVEPAEDIPDGIAVRVQEALAHQAKHGTVEVTVTDRDNLGPSRMLVTYPPSVRDDSPDTRAAWQDIIASKAPGRWRPDWDTHANRLTLTRRPAMPPTIAHPAPDNSDSWTLPFATDEDHDPVVWDLHKAPHALVIGGTGSGKTVLLRALITEAAYRGFGIYICDPKRIEMAGFRGWPSVVEVATSTEEMIDLIAFAYTEMDRRYEAVEAGDIDTDALTPLLIVVDEAREFIDRVNAHWKATKVSGQSGTEHPAVEQWRSIARLGRSARVHLLVGIQRPDAKVFGGEARDNYGARIALGSLSEAGARMMFGASDIGRDLPTTAKGRVTVDLNDRVAEAQTWWTPDARGTLTATDEAILDALRPAKDLTPTLPKPVPLEALSAVSRTGAKNRVTARGGTRKVEPLPGSVWVRRTADLVSEGETIRHEGVTAVATTDSEYVDGDTDLSRIEVRLRDGSEAVWDLDSNDAVEVRA